MITPELASYVKTELDRGVAKEDLQKALVSAGWPAPDVEEALHPGAKLASTEPTAAASASPHPDFDIASLLSTDAPKTPLSEKLHAVQSMLSGLIGKISRKKDSVSIEGAPAQTALSDDSPAGLLARFPGGKWVIAGGGMFLVAMGMFGATYVYYLKPHRQPKTQVVASLPAAAASPAVPTAPAANHPPAEQKANPAEVANSKKNDKPLKTTAASKTEAKAAQQKAKAPADEAGQSLESAIQDGSELVRASGGPLVDTDGDGLDDEMEAMLGTNSRKRDTDGDGVNDGAEVKRGEDPTSPN